MAYIKQLKDLLADKKAGSKPLPTASSQKTSVAKTTTPTVTTKTVTPTTAVATTPTQSAVATSPTGIDSIAQQLQDLQNQQAQAYQQAYGSNRDAINSLYNNAIQNAQSLYGQQTSALQNALNLQKQNVETSAEKSLREAYINKMMNEKNLEQRLTAQGLSGGASESAMASLLNQYGGSRNEIEQAKLSDLASAESNYGQNLASLLYGLQSATSSAEQARLSGLTSLENSLANQQAGLIGNRATQLQNLYETNLADQRARYEADLADQRARATASARRSSSESEENESTFNIADKYPQYAKQIMDLKNRGYTANMALGIIGRYGLTPAEQAALMNLAFTKS